MNKDVAGLLKACVVAACLFWGSGCKREPQPAPQSDAAALPADDEGAPAVDAAAAELVDDLEGVWATSRNVDNDDAETVYVIETVDVGQLRLTRDGTALDAQVEDIDPAQGTVTLRDQTGGGPVEALTIRKRKDPDGSGGFSLWVTYGNGQRDGLGFVRRLSVRDRETLATAFAKPVLPPVADETAGDDAEDCSVLTDFRERALCADPGLSEQNQELMERLEFLVTSIRDVNAVPTRQAAIKQLDACSNSDCLRKAYARWIAYLDDNYDAGNRMGMAE